MAAWRSDALLVPEAIPTTAPHRPYAHWRSLGLLAITQGTRIDDDQVEAG
jgi:hypothetical protein